MLNYLEELEKLQETLFSMFVHKNYKAMTQISNKESGQYNFSLNKMLRWGLSLLFFIITVDRQEQRTFKQWI